VRVPVLQTILEEEVVPAQLQVVRERGGELDRVATAVQIAVPPATGDTCLVLIASSDPDRSLHERQLALDHTHRNADRLLLDVDVLFTNRHPSEELGVIQRLLALLQLGVGVDLPGRQLHLAPDQCSIGLEVARDRQRTDAELGSRIELEDKHRLGRVASQDCAVLDGGGDVAAR
jgi:hypothetical protein